jgi:hypothetical protein
MPTKHSKDLKTKAANNLERGKIQTPTWTDPKTTLEWQCESAGEMSWNEALEYAQSLSLGGKDDWRIPIAKIFLISLRRIVWASTFTIEVIPRFIELGILEVERPKKCKPSLLEL